MEALSTLGHFLLTLVIGLVVLTVLVFVHELGHYLVAKKYGMRVNAFAIFMGGVRKTDLDPWLEKPLAPTKLVWAAFAVSFLAAMVGALAQANPVYLAGLVGAGVAVPLWAMLRMAALYHVPTGRVLGIWVKSLAVGAAVLAFGTKLQGIDANLVIGVAAGATLIALAIVYYIPVQMREIDDDKQGFGEIIVGPGEKVPVRFRPIWSKAGRDGTEFSLLLLPLGGFAQIGGMHAKPDGSEVAIEGGFYSKSPLKRLAVLFAGPLFSLLFGLLLLFGLFATSGHEVPDSRPIVAEYPERKEGPSAAQKAGILPGDVIVSVDGQSINEFYDITVAVRDKWRETEDGKHVGIPVEVVYRRDDVEQKVTIVPEVDDEPEPIRNRDMELSSKFAVQARLGVAYNMIHESLSVSGAAIEAIKAPIKMVEGLVSTVTNISNADRQVAGPTAMAKVTSAAVSEGVYYVLWYAAVLSISLGVMNLLPIVPLDGGQMIVAFVEMLRGGRRLSLNVQNLLANSGIALLVLMMLAVSAVDLGRSADANKRAEKQEQAK